MLSARKRAIKRGNVENLKNEKRRIQTRNPGETLETPVVIPHAPQSHVIIVGKKVIYLENVGGSGGNRGGGGVADLAADRWQRSPDPWRQCKRF